MAFVHAVGGDGPEAGKVELIGRVVRRRPRAVLVAVDGLGEMWLPMRPLVLRDLSDGRTLVWMPQWLARLKGILEWTTRRKASSPPSKRGSRRKTART